MSGEDDLELAGLDFVPCVAWVRRGVAKQVPEKVELSKDELADLIKQTRGEIEDIDAEENDEEENADESEIKDEADEQVKAETDDTEVKDEVMSEDEDDKIAAEYGLDDYDDEDESDVLMGLEGLTVHAVNEEDPLMTVHSDDDNSSDESDFNLLPTDNLIAVGHVEGDAAVLEVYVYNAEEAHLYVHHEAILPALPLCMEWIDYDPSEELPGNYLAVGSMASIIDVWDLDLVGSLEPAFRLGRKKSKKKKLSAVGHNDAVLSLSWNPRVRTVLASGSADNTVLLWDMSQGSVASTLSHNEKIQGLKWHPFEAQTLLTGACDGQLRVYDCRSQDSYRSWQVEGEIEKVIWDHFNPFCFLASTDTGAVHYFDARNDKAVWQLQAHNKACTGLSLSWQCPGCLTTASQDKMFKVWDIAEGKPSFVAEQDMKIGNIYALSGCPDAPFAFCLGGDYRSENFKVWDIRQSAAVRNRFENRQLIQPLVTTQPQAAASEAGVAEEATGAASSSPAESGTQKKEKKKKTKTNSS